MGKGELMMTFVSVAGSIIVALIGAWVSTKNARESNEITLMTLRAELEKHNAVQDTKLEALTQAVEKHNNFAMRMPVVEEKVKHLEEGMKEVKRS